VKVISQIRTKSAANQMGLNLDENMQQNLEQKKLSTI
jgi:hypothetical protein